jgi:hypothetical protein
MNTELGVMQMAKTSKISAKDNKPDTGKGPLTASAAATKPGAKVSRKMTTEERDLAVRLTSASIADAVGLYMRSDRHKHMSIADLEWMLLPPLMLNQLKFAYARPTQAKDKTENNTETLGQSEEKMPPIAVAKISWARVSP